MKVPWGPEKRVPWEGGLSPGRMRVGCSEGWPGLRAAGDGGTGDQAAEAGRPLKATLRPSPCLSMRTKCSTAMKTHTIPTASLLENCQRAS